MKIGKINLSKRFMTVLLSVLILASVVVLPANAETIENNSSMATEVKFKEVSSGGHSAAITSDGRGLELLWTTW